MKNLCWRGKALKKLTFSNRFKSSGRNSSGSITIFHRGGGVKKLQRRIDFRRNTFESGTVERIEYDPNRSSRIALVRWSGNYHQSALLKQSKHHDFESSIFQKQEIEVALARPKVQVQKTSIEAKIPDKLFPEGVSLKDLHYAPAIRQYFSYILASSKLKPGDKITNIFSNTVAFTEAKSKSVRLGKTTLKLSDRFLLPKENQKSKAYPQSQDHLSNKLNYMLRTLELQNGCLEDASVTDIQKTTISSILDDSRERPRAFEINYRSSLLNQPPNSIMATVTSQSGSSAPLWYAPLGSVLHNIELYPGNGGKLVRAAGTSAQLVQKFENNLCMIRLPSGADKLLDSRCRASFGIVSNESHNTYNLTKAGQSRWQGKRPIVRGVAMNPIDHPHGGGEGRTKGGRPSVSPWGKPTKSSYRKKRKIILRHKSRRLAF